MFFLVSTSVAFVLISVALTEFCTEFECFSQDLTDNLLILWQIRLLSSLYLPALCIKVLRDREQSAAPVFCRFVLHCQILLPPIKTVGSTIRQRKIIPVKLCFINVYTYHNIKPTVTVMHIQ